MSNQLQDGDRDTQVLSHAPINLAYPSHIVVEYNELDQKREKNRIAKRRNRQAKKERRNSQGPDYSYPSHKDEQIVEKDLSSVTNATMARFLAEGIDQAAAINKDHNLNERDTPIFDFETLPCSFTDLPEFTGPDTILNDISMSMMEDSDNYSRPSHCSTTKAGQTSEGVEGLPTPMSPAKVTINTSGVESTSAQQNVQRLSWLRLPVATQLGPGSQIPGSDCTFKKGIPDKEIITSTTVNENRLAKIVALVEESGFNSIDELVTEYYTLQVNHDAELASTQSHSRSRNLRNLLEALHESSKQWSPRESSPYREGILRTAEALLREEVKKSLDGLDRCNDDDLLSLGSSNPARSARDSILSHLNIPAHNDALTSFMRHDMTRLRNNSPELFSLLSELVRNSPSRRNDRSLAVCMFLYQLGL